MAQIILEECHNPFILQNQVEGSRGGLCIPLVGFRHDDSLCCMLFLSIDSSLRKLQVNIELRPDFLHEVKDTEFGFGRHQVNPAPLFFYLNKKPRLGNDDNFSYSTAPNISSAMLTQVIETPPDLEPLMII
jgi:hypothetical protein